MVYLSKMSDIWYYFEAWDVIKQIMIKLDNCVLTDPPSFWYYPGEAQISENP